MRIRLPGIIYLVVGVIVASGHHYFAHVNALHRVIAAGLAIVLWPLVLLGIGFHVT
jgi:hypothetical protein